MSERSSIAMSGTSRMVSRPRNMPAADSSSSSAASSSAWPPELRFSQIHALAREAPRSNNLYALFDCEIDAETGQYLSEDYAFCRRWRALGGEIWLDLRSRLTHIGPDHFRGDAGKRFPEAIAPV